MKRRDFTLGALFLVSSPAVLAQGLDTNTFLAQIASAQDGDKLVYDPKERLLYGSFAGGETLPPRQTVGHPTRQSLSFAVALLNSKRDDVLPVGLGVLDRVLGLQNVDPASSTYGTWPKRLGEPLSKPGPADGDEAALLASALLDVAFEHPSLLPADLAGRVTSALVHLARSVEKADAPPYLSSLAATGASIALAAVQLSGDAALSAVGQKRLQMLADWTAWNGGEAFSEYNSPICTETTLGALNQIKKYVKSADALVVNEKLLRVAWQEVANHYHAPSGQWAGPYCQTNRDLIDPKNRASLLARAQGGECPPDLVPLFSPTAAARTVSQTSARGGSFAPLAGRIARLPAAERVMVSGTKPIVQTTYLHPRFALGSVNRGALGFGRRPFIAHWGTLNAPSYLTLRFLCDGQDSAQAQFFSIQRYGILLGAVCLATDGAGDSKNPSQQKGFAAKDVRLRFEIGGASAKALLPLSGSQPNLLCQNDDMQIGLQAPVAYWDDKIGTWESGADDRAAYCDLVLYKGASKTFVPTRMFKSVAAFLLMLRPTPPSGTPRGFYMDSEVEVSDLGLTIKSDRMFLAVPSLPAPVETLHIRFETKGLR